MAVGKVQAGFCAIAAEEIPIRKAAVINPVARNARCFIIPTFLALEILEIPYGHRDRVFPARPVAFASGRTSGLDGVCRELTV
jgi:hypothetical protein